MIFFFFFFKKEDKYLNVPFECFEKTKTQKKWKKNWLDTLLLCTEDCENLYDAALN